MVARADTGKRRLAWTKAYRIIASRYPPIDLFERLTPDPLVWEALIALEQRVNPRLRDELGEIALVPHEERVTGPGASWVMAAFTHVNPKGSRFSDGTYGVYYAAKALLTAVHETAHHFGRFAKDAGDTSRDEDMRVLASGVKGHLLDVAALSQRKRNEILKPDTYAASQDFARTVRNEGYDGVAYPSVRHKGGVCVAAFRPKAILSVKEDRRLRYHWDGKTVSRFFDYKEDRWFSLT